MTKLLLNLFIKGEQNYNKPQVRKRIGILSGCVGIVINLLLFGIKLFSGIISSSIAITADAFNNLSDAGSSVVTVVGFKLSNKPADKKHPFGHGRVEYIAAFIISIAIFIVAFELITSSIEKIINPTRVDFAILPAILLVVSIIAKLIMCVFNKKLGKLINSPAMKATALDSVSDAIATTAVLVGSIISHFSGLMIDGYLGLLVAVFIIYSGYTTIKDAMDLLLGNQPSPEFIDQIKNTVLSHKQISAMHDLIVHNYGEGKYMVSLHAEVPTDCDIVEIHEVIDHIEMELKSKYGCSATIHMDPVITDDAATTQAKSMISNILKQVDPTLAFHDFRMVKCQNHINYIFDVELTTENKNSADAIENEVCSKLEEINPHYFAVINFDAHYL